MQRRAARIIGTSRPARIRRCPPLEAEAFAKKLEDVIRGFQAIKLTHRAMKDQLNQLGIPAARGGKWSLIQVQRLLARIEPSHP